MKKIINENSFKYFDSVLEVNGWGKMYYCFDDLDRYDSPYLLNYLIDTEPIIKWKCLESGFEDYLRYSDSFITEKIVGVSKYILKAMLTDLENHNYIFIHNGSNRDSKNGYRYIKLNHEKIAKALGIDISDTNWNTVNIDKAKELYYNEY